MEEECLETKVSTLYAARVICQELRITWFSTSTYMFEDVAHPDVERLACYWGVFFEKVGVGLLPEGVEVGLQLEDLGLPPGAAAWGDGCSVCGFAAELLGCLGEF